MHRLKNIRDCLLTSVEGQMGHLDCVNAQELGEVVDMVKDMEEAMYYHTEAKKNCMELEEFEHMEKEGYSKRHYPPYVFNPVEEHYRDMDKSHGRMYYPRDIHRGNYANEEEYSYPMEIRDSREGKSPISRKNYMESKELHHAPEKQMKELERYLQELSQDVTEMIKDATPEEKSMLQQKLSTLVTKIKNV